MGAEMSDRERDLRRYGDTALSLASWIQMYGRGRARTMALECLQQCPPLAFCDGEGASYLWRSGVALALHDAFGGVRA